MARGNRGRGEELVEETSNSLFGHAKGLVTGAIGGAFKGIFGWGLLLFGLQATGAAAPIAQAIGGDELAARVAALGTNADGVANIGQRLITSAIGGAVMGAAGGGASGLVNGNGQKGMIDNIVGIGASLVAAAVVVGSVKNGNFTPPPPAAAPQPRVNH